MKLLDVNVWLALTLWMDAWLAAFAIQAGLQLVTTDKAFSQFKGLHALVLKAP